MAKLEKTNERKYTSDEMLNLQGVEKCAIMDMNIVENKTNNGDPLFGC